MSNIVFIEICVGTPASSGCVLLEMNIMFLNFLADALHHSLCKELYIALKILL